MENTNVTKGFVVVVSYQCKTSFGDIYERSSVLRERGMGAKFFDVRRLAEKAAKEKEEVEELHSCVVEAVEVDGRIFVLDGPRR